MYNHKEYQVVKLNSSLKLILYDRTPKDVKMYVISEDVLFTQLRKYIFNVLKLTYSDKIPSTRYNNDILYDNQERF